MTLEPRKPDAIARPVGELLEHAVELARDSIAPSTKRAYAGDWAAFVEWADEHGVATGLPVQVEAVAAWIAAMDHGGLALSTVRRRVRGLAFVHRAKDVESPTTDRRVRAVLKGLARRRAGERVRKKRAISPSMVRAALDHLSTRDRAIVLVAIVTGLRRSELAALTWGDLQETDEGAIAWVRVSKTDQEGEGAPVAVPRAGGVARPGRAISCPVGALTQLRIERGDPEQSERIFDVCPQTISNVIKRAAAAAGEDPRQFGAHSARAGFLTTATKAGASLADMMLQSRHRSVAVALGYVRPGEVSKNPAARAVVEALR